MGQAPELPQAGRHAHAVPAGGGHQHQHQPGQQGARQPAHGAPGDRGQLHSVCLQLDTDIKFRVEMFYVLCVKF